MLVTRIFSGDDGLSHFEDLDVPLDTPGDNNHSSEPVPLEGVVFRSTAPGSIHDWHTAPRRQFVVTLRGQLEVRCGDGAARVFGPGDVVLADDVTGHGHTATLLSQEGRLSLALLLDENVDISCWRRIEEATPPPA